MVYSHVERIMRLGAAIVGLAVFTVACQANEGELCQSADECKLGLTCQAGQCRSVATLRRERILQRALVGSSTLPSGKIKSACLAPFECPIACPAKSAKQTDRQEDQGWVVGCRLPNKVWHGPFNHWFANGNKRYSGAYWQGKRSGEWSQWHRNGIKKSLGSYENNKREGRWFTWHRNGQRAEIGEYRAGKRSGKFEFWTEETGAYKEARFPTIDKME